MILIIGMALLPSRTSAEVSPTYPEIPFVTIEQSLDFARMNNLEIRAAGEALAAANFGIKAAKALDWFTLTGGVSTTKTGPSISAEIAPGEEIEFTPSEFQHSLSITLAQPIVTFGLNKNLKKAATISRDIAIAEYEAALNNIRLQVETSFYDLLFLEELILVQNASLQRAENDKRIAELRFDAGQVAKFEVIRAEVAVRNADEVLITTRKNLAVAKVAWTRLLGAEGYRPPMRNRDHVVMNPDLPFTLDEANELALRMRPEIRGLQAAVDATEVGANLKSLRPDLRFISSYNRTTTSTAFSTGESWRFSLNLNVPLWDGGKAEAEFAAGMHQVEQLKIQLEDFKRVVGIEVADAYLSVRESLERLESSSATLDLALEAKRMAELGYEQGVITQQELLSAEVDTASAEVNRLGAVYDYLKALAKLRHALGVDVLPAGLEAG